VERTTAARAPRFVKSPESRPCGKMIMGAPLCPDLQRPTRTRSATEAKDPPESE